MDELFGDDEPKVNKPRPNNKQRPSSNVEDLPQLRGNKGRKKKDDKSTVVNYKETLPELKKT